MKKRSLGLLIALALLLPAALAQATTTTVMMYMCGTDLQSYCVQDMYEMASVDLPEDVTIAVQAGGAYEWDDSDLTGEAINRFTIRYDAFNDVETYPWQNMGDKQTLYDFIDWAVDRHPADRYILVLWDHGGASGGVCYDETADYDSLTIHEVNDALYEYAERNTSFHLDIIGFDACLMATYEMAAHMAGYADYMVASGNLCRLSHRRAGKRPDANHQPSAPAHVRVRQILGRFLRSGGFHGVSRCDASVCAQHGQPAGIDLSSLHLLLWRHGYV